MSNKIAICSKCGRELSDGRTCQLHGYVPKPSYKEEGIMKNKILGIGTIIEFNGQRNGKVTKERYADIVGSIHIYSDGRVAYWGDSYPEVPGEDYEIFSDRLIDSFKQVEFKENHGDFPFFPKDHISFNWDENTFVKDGIVESVFYVYSSHLLTQWRAEVIGDNGENYYIGQDELEDLNLKVKGKK